MQLPVQGLEVHHGHSQNSRHNQEYKNHDQKKKHDLQAYWLQIDYNYADKEVDGVGQRQDYNLRRLITVHHKENQGKRVDVPSFGVLGVILVGD